MDATLIAASPSTKNGAGQRDREMSQSKKGNQWYFGMKTHIGVDMRSGLVHSAAVTTGSVDDAKAMHDLIRPDDRVVFGDKGYAGDRKKRGTPGGPLLVDQGPAQPGRQLSASRKHRTRGMAPSAQGRACVPCAQCQFGYRGIVKNAPRVFWLLALANLCLARRKLMAA